MHKILLWLVLFIVCMCSSCAPAVAQDPVRKAMDRARVEKKHVFVYFSTDGCAPCHRMERETLESTTYKLFLPKHYVYVKIVNPSDTLITEYRIRCFPTYVIVSPDGDVTAWGEGYKNVGEFTKWHNGFMGVKRPLRTLFKILMVIR